MLGLPWVGAGEGSGDLVKLYVFEKGDDQYIEREASRADRLRADGWEDCEYEECNGSGIAAHFCEESRDRCARGEHPECSNCQGLGLVPPDGMVEAAAKAMEPLAPNAPLRWYAMARAALVAAARWEAP